MKTVTMLDFRRRAADILREVARGRNITLTHRGRPTARLEPVRHAAPARRGAVDSFYMLDRLAVRDGKSMGNTEMDSLVYGA
jgi:prevent-host-death family protein